MRTKQPARHTPAWLNKLLGTHATNVAPVLTPPRARTARLAEGSTRHRGAFTIRPATRPFVDTRTIAHDRVAS